MFKSQGNIKVLTLNTLNSNFKSIKMCQFSFETWKKKFYNMFVWIFHKIITFPYRKRDVENLISGLISLKLIKIPGSTVKLINDGFKLDLVFCYLN